MTFTIKRSKWLRGTGEESFLLRGGDRFQCCIGQCASQVGIPDFELLNESALRHVKSETVRKRLPGFFYCGRTESDWVFQAYTVNDATHISEADRESKLSALAAANGHEFIFVD